MSGIIDCEMHIGDEVFVHGYIDEIRNDTIIIRNVGGYFGTSRDEVFYYEEDERGYGTMNEADRKTEPKTQTKTQNSNLTFEKDECAKEYEELGLKELKELIEADRKTESNSEKPNNRKDEPTISKMEQVDKDIDVLSKDEPYIDIETGILHWCGWKYKRIYEDEPQTCEDCKHNGEKHAYDYACDKCTDMDKFQHEDEPQVIMPKKCKGCDSASKIIEAYSRGFEDGAEAVKAMPQTERSE